MKWPDLQAAARRFRHIPDKPPASPECLPQGRTQGDVSDPVLRTGRGRLRCLPCAGARVPHVLWDKAPHCHNKFFRHLAHFLGMADRGSRGFQSYRARPGACPAQLQGPEGRWGQPARSPRLREGEEPGGRFLTNKSWSPGNHMASGWYEKQNGICFRLRQRHCWEKGLWGTQPGPWPGTGGERGPADTTRTLRSNVREELGRHVRNAGMSRDFEI